LNVQRMHARLSGEYEYTQLNTQLYGLIVIFGNLYSPSKMVAKYNTKTKQHSGNT